MSGKKKDRPSHPASLIMIGVGGKNIPAVSESRCHTCQHPDRMRIEVLLTQGYAYKRVAEQISKESGTEVGWWSIRDHYKNGHFPLQGAAIRRLSENRTQELGVAIDEASDLVVDHVVVSKAILQKGFERLTSGAMVPDVKDTLAAAKLVKEIEDTALGNLDQQVWSDAFVQFFETARAVMTAQQYEQFGMALATNPVLKAIEAKQANIVDAEIEESA